MEKHFVQVLFFYLKENVYLLDFFKFKLQNNVFMYLGIDLNDLMKLGSVVNDDELDTARKSVMMFKTIKQFQNSFMEIEKVHM